MNPLTPEVTNAVFTQYGLAGFVVVACLGALIYVVKDLLRKSDTKDNHMVSLTKDFSAATKEFSCALKDNANAIERLNESEIKLANATNEFQKWLRDATERHEKDHKEILNALPNVPMRRAL